MKLWIVPVLFFLLIYPYADGLAGAKPTQGNHENKEAAVAMQETANRLLRKPLISQYVSSKSEKWAIDDQLYYLHQNLSTDIEYRWKECTGNIACRDNGDENIEVMMQSPRHIVNEWDGYYYLFFQVGAVGRRPCYAGVLSESNHAPVELTLKTSMTLGEKKRVFQSTVRLEPLQVVTFSHRIAKSTEVQSAGANMRPQLYCELEVTLNPLNRCPEDWDANVAEADLRNKVGEIVQVVLTVQGADDQSGSSARVDLNGTPLARYLQVTKSPVSLVLDLKRGVNIIRVTRSTEGPFHSVATYTVSSNWQTIIKREWGLFPGGKAVIILKR